MPKIDGQLKNAQFEELAATNPTPQARSRFYSDITNPASAVPKFHTGTGYLPLRMGQTDAIVNAGNSGKAITIDWNLGLVQKVTLTDNCIVSLSNGRPGEIHTLVIVQSDTFAAEADQKVVAFNIPDQCANSQPFGPTGRIPRGVAYSYSWYYAADAVPAYTTIPRRVAAPITLPPDAGFGCSWAPDGKSVASGHATSPYVFYYRVSEEASTELTFGARNLLTPTTTPATANAIAFSPNGLFIAVATDTTPFINVYNNAGGYSLTALANPGTLPANEGKHVAWHPSGRDLIVAHEDTPYISAYPFGSGGFGSKYSDPGTTPTGNAACVAFNPTGDFVAVAHATTPFISAYPWTVGVGFGTKIADPATLPTGEPTVLGGHCLAWHPTSKWLVYGNDTDFLYIVAFDPATGTFGAKQNISGWLFSPVSAAVNAVAFSPCGYYLVIGFQASPYMAIANFNPTTGLVTSSPALTYDGSNPGQNVNDIAFSPSGEYILLSLAASPYIMVYPAPRALARNYLRVKNR